MELNYVLIWVVGVSVIMALARLQRADRERCRGWIWVHAALLGLLGAGLLWFPGLAGYVAMTAWLVWVLVPSQGLRLLWRWTLQRRYRAAGRLAELLRWLHPFDTYRHRPLLLRAMWLAQSGETAAALNMLRRLVVAGGAVGWAAAAQMYRIAHRWKELAEWIQSSPTPTRLLRDPGLLLLYLRALGETGDLDRMQWAYAQYGGALEGAGHRSSRDFARMMMLAFFGRVGAVEQLLSDSLDWLPVATQEFWRATAEAAAGERQRAQQRLTRLLEWETDAVSLADIQQRLQTPLPLGTEKFLHLITCLEQPPAPQNWRGAKLTVCLVALNVAMFLVETAAGGSRDEAVLFRLGALSAQAVAAGEWWRLLAAMFLHYGWLHLAMNMLGLVLLGPFVEMSLGRLRFAFTYLGSGLASMGAVLWLMRTGWLADDLLVGASGSIMGLVGATAIVLVRHWQAGSQLAFRRLQRVVLAVALQAIFDLVTPQVSMAAHTSGVLAGGLIAFLLTLEREEA
ncbi:MAG: rhomboid family intramembrane serine protease [Verrucomicrobiae bacterium]|nr:rhomboid family intramembrane serine protease [Verrucomicrobiae bacterium]